MATSRLGASERYDYSDLGKSTTKKQPAANFFDYEDESLPNDVDLVTNVIPVQPGLPEIPKHQQENANKIENLSSKLFELKFQDNVDRRIERIIESTVQSLTCPSSPSTKLSPRQAVERIFAGDSAVNLDVFRGKEQKLELLDYALLTGDKYTMIKVILFLEATLKSSIFFYELQHRPVAADHYLIYLKNNAEQWDQQLNVLNIMGRHEDAAFAMYAKACRSDVNPQQQIKLLERSLLNFAIGGPEVMQWEPYIREHISLLEQQLPIEADDRRRADEALKISSGDPANPQAAPLSVQTEDNQLFVIYPRPSTLVALPLMETLRYCCLYHYHLPDNNFASPFHLRKKFKITDRQFLWNALESLAKAGRWNEIDNLFEYKSWLGSRKIRSNLVPVSDIVQVLYRNSSPPELIEKYLELVDDTEHRFQLAKDFHMNKFAADILIKLRDRKRLSELRQSINTKSEMDYVQRYIDNALVSSSIKWRN